MRNVILISDLSTNSSRDIEMATTLASDFNGSVHVIFLLHEDDDRQFNLTKKMNAILKPFRSSDIKITSLIVRWNIMHAIDKFHIRDSNEIVMIPLNDESEFKIATPEIIKKVIYNISSPKLIYSNIKYPDDFSNVLLAFDNLDGAVIPQLSFLKELENVFSTKINLLNVIDPSANNGPPKISDLEKIAEDYGFKNYSINTVYNENFMDGLNYFADKKSLNTQFIITPTTQHSKSDKIDGELNEMGEHVLMVI